MARVQGTGVGTLGEPRWLRYSVVRISLSVGFRAFRVQCLLKGPLFVVPSPSQDDPTPTPSPPCFLVAWFVFIRDP